jgi:hypothetical protein
MMRLVSCATLLTLLLGLLGCQARPAPKPSAPSAPALTVKAGDLLKDYGGNAIAADSKYKGKFIRVTGKFNSAQPVPLYGYAVQLVAEDAGDLNASMVQCFLEESAKEEVGKFQQGQMIAMQGTCEGQPLPGQVRLSKCTVAK